MAQKSNTARPSFYEVVFQGKPKVVRAFLTGLTMGAGGDATIYYSFLDGVHHEGKAEKLAELVHIRSTDCHVIVDSATSKLLKKLARRLQAETGLEIASHRRVKSASLKFWYTTYGPKYDEQILAEVKNLPQGLKLADFQHDVEVDPKAKGVEAYAVAHHFEAKGSGTITGRVDMLIELKKKMADYPLIQSEDVKLELA
jgi:hypothetical protein